MMILAKIVSGSYSKTMLQSEEKVATMYPKTSETTVKSTPFGLAEQFTNFNNRTANVYYRIANTKANALEYIQKGDFTTLPNVLVKAEHRHHDTEIDTWDESSLSFTIKGGETIDFNKILSKNVGKFIALEII